jgi:hypothetical protein
VTEPIDCVDPDHFMVTERGEISPQPWMQWRNVGTVSALTKTAKYSVTGGGNKNALIHSLTLSYVNDTPLPQWVYGLITRGGSRVSLQARSRGGLSVWSGYKQTIPPAAADAGVLKEASVMGCGADLGRSGTLGTGTTFGVIESRQASVTFPLAPERVGWHKLPVGARLTAKVEVRFITGFWENTTIDGGSRGSESGYESGDTRLDLFAVPVLSDPPL